MPDYASIDGGITITSILSKEALILLVQTMNFIDNGLQCF